MSYPLGPSGSRAAAPDAGHDVTRPRSRGSTAPTHPPGKLTAAQTLPAASATSALSTANPGHSPQAPHSPQAAQAPHPAIVQHAQDLSLHDTKRFAVRIKALEQRVDNTIVALNEAVQRLNAQEATLYKHEWALRAWRDEDGKFQAGMRLSVDTIIERGNQLVTRTNVLEQQQVTGLASLTTPLQILTSRVDDLENGVAHAAAGRDSKHLCAASPASAVDAHAVAAAPLAPTPAAVHAGHAGLHERIDGLQRRVGGVNCLLGAGLSALGSYGLAALAQAEQHAPAGADQGPLEAARVVAAVVTGLGALTLLAGLVTCRRTASTRH